MVAGQRFADDQVNALAEQASLVIAHNAAFDRQREGLGDLYEG